MELDDLPPHKKNHGSITKKIGMNVHPKRARVNEHGTTTQELWQQSSQALIDAVLEKEDSNYDRKKYVSVRYIYKVESKDFNVSLPDNKCLAYNRSNF